MTFPAGRIYGTACPRLTRRRSRERPPSSRAIWVSPSTSSSSASALGARLKEAREYRGFLQDDVAKSLGLPRSAISLIESGNRRVDVLELRKLATLYDCTLEELTGETPQDVQTESVQLLTRAAKALSPEDRSEVLRFAEFLLSQKSRKQK
jgi:transcriptional regulator with XRE-family HTH domain